MNSVDCSLTGFRTRTIWRVSCAREVPSCSAQAPIHNGRTTHQPKAIPLIHQWGQVMRQCLHLLLTSRRRRLRYSSLCSHPLGFLTVLLIRCEGTLPFMAGVYKNLPAGADYSDANGEGERGRCRGDGAYMLRSACVGFAAIRSSGVR